MTEPLRPDAAKLYGKDNWILVLALADYTSPLTSEVIAVSALDITRIIFTDSARPTANTNLVDANRRYGDTETFQRVGTTTHAGGLMTYAIDDQAAAASSPKKLFEKIPEGLAAFLVNRRGIGRAVAPDDDQFVHVYPVEFGLSVPMPSGDGEAAESAMQAAFAITGPPEFMVQLQGA